MNLNIFYHLIKLFETFQLIESFINGIFAFKKFPSSAKKNLRILAVDQKF